MEQDVLLPFTEEPRATIYNGPTNSLVCIKTLIQMSHIKTFKITPSSYCFVMSIPLCLSVSLSVCPHVSALLQLNGFP
jgi:hypothetical protein